MEMPTASAVLQGQTAEEAELDNPRLSRSSTASRSRASSSSTRSPHASSAAILTFRDADGLGPPRRSARRLRAMSTSTRRIICADRRRSGRGFSTAPDPSQAVEGHLRLRAPSAEATYLSARRPGSAAPSDEAGRRSGAVDRRHARRHCSRSGAGCQFVIPGEARWSIAKGVASLLPRRDRRLSRASRTSWTHRRTGSPDHASASPENGGCRFRPLLAP